MKAEIIAIGTELLLGHIVNTNTAYLSQQLAHLGIDVYYHTTVGDNPQRLSKTLQQTLEHSDIVLTIGGLGPTVDDITLRTVVDTTGCKLILDKTTSKRIRDQFQRQKIKMPIENIRQAYVPKGATIMNNDVGTAPGIIMKVKDRILILLPGPPSELIPMFERDAIPYLKKIVHGGWIIKSTVLKTTGLAESQVNHKVKDLLSLKPPVTVGIYVHPAQVDLKVTAKAKDEKTADKLISDVERKLNQMVGSFIFGKNEDTLEGIIADKLTKSKRTLAIAESCTGGLISNRLTNIPGSSKYFKMSIVAYSNESKMYQLGISRESLERYGAVSREVAIAMAKKVRVLAKTYFGLGVTGIVGPTGGTREKPIGLVYIALSYGKKNVWRKFIFTGGRLLIRLRASQAALDMLRHHLSR